MSSSLSSVVSNLVRAQMGTSLSSSVTDDELDRHVAELILKEAKKKAQTYSQHGIRAYLRNNIIDSNAPKTNKRFLTSIIRSTDDHNKTVLRAQALAAEEVKKARADDERKERRARAEEAVAAEKMRRSRGEGSSSSSKSKRRKEEDEGWDHWDGRTADRKRRPRHWETWVGGDSVYSEDDRVGDSARKRRRRHRSSSRPRDKDGHRHSRRRDSEKDEPSSRRRRHRARSPDRDGEKRRKSHHDKPDDSSRKRKSSASPSEPRSRYTNDEDNNISDDSCRGRRRRHVSPSRSRSPPHIHIRGSDSCSRKPSPSIRHESRSVSPSPHHSLKGKQKASSDLPNPAASPKLVSWKYSSSSQTAMSISEPESRASTPGPDPLPQLPSKMDKYFEESYDPRLDVAPLTAPKVPATGLINDEEFYGWDSMLELIRQRNEDRAERKRLERLGIPVTKTAKNKKTLGGSAAMDERWDAGGTSIMEIEYKKRGSVREWDMGKEGF